MSHTEVADLDWSAEKLLPTFQAPQSLVVYDIRHASPAIQLSAATFVGIINRPQPQVYLVTVDDDLFWLQQLPPAISQENAPVSGDDVLIQLLLSYKNKVQGIIIYDPNNKHTINVATTLAGLRNGFVVAPTMADALKQAYDLPVLADLRSYNWKTALQAYDWARQNLLPACSTRLIAGLAPDNMAGLRSFAVATKTFVYYLDSRSYLPDLSDGILSERVLMQQIISSYPASATHLGWFIDESSGVNITSQAAIPVLATDIFFNLEVWSAIQPQTTTQVQVQDNQAVPTDKKVYVSFTISDGDNLQYSQHRMLSLWRDSARGSFPLGWTISPVLLHAAPVLMEYYKSTATANDEFIAGPSGAGYMFPSHWPSEHIPDFLQRTGKLLQETDITLLEILDTDFWQSSGLPFIANIRQTGMIFSDANCQNSFAQGLRPYGLKGFLSGAGLRKPDWKKVDGLPLYQNVGLADSVAGTVNLVKGAAGIRSERPLFINVYVLAWKMTPSALKQVIQQLGPNYEIVLPGTLLAGLARTLA